MLLCQNCKTEISKNDIFCPECGVKIETPEPTLSNGDIIVMVVVSILLFPLGILIALIYYYSFNKKREKWRHEQLITAIKE